MRASLGGVSKHADIRALAAGWCERKQRRSRPQGTSLQGRWSYCSASTAVAATLHTPHSIPLHLFFSRSNPSHRLCYLGASGRRDRCLSRGCICFGRHRVGRVHGEGHTCLIAIPLTLCLHQAAPQRCLQPICNGDCWFAPRSCRSSSS